MVFSPEDHPGVPHARCLCLRGTPHTLPRPPVCVGLRRIDVVAVRALPDLRSDDLSIPRRLVEWRGRKRRVPSPAFRLLREIDAAAEVAAAEGVTPGFRGGQRVEAATGSKYLTIGDDVDRLIFIIERTPDPIRLEGGAIAGYLARRSGPPDASTG